jgi:tetratricopeptide (TPR) repeat protein
MTSRRFLGLSLVLTVCQVPFLWGEGSNPPAITSTTARKSSAPETQFEEDLRAARTAANGNDLSGAEAALTAHNRFQSNTSEWHLETAQKLTQLAINLGQNGSSGATIDPVTDLTLEHLEHAHALSKNPATRAQAKAASAAIYLKFKGDLQSAIRYYQAAAALDPGDPGIRQALARLVSTDAKLRARLLKANH